MRDDRDRLKDILEAIRLIDKYASRGHAAFDQDELIRTWIIHHIQIVGEAVRSLSQELKDANPQVPWAEIAAMRNILAHVYFGVDPDKVWSAVEKDVPTLRAAIEQILKALGSADDVSSPS